MIGHTPRGGTIPVDEFFAHRSHDLPERIRRLEDWASTFAGRATNDPAVKQATSSSSAPSGGGGTTGSTTSQVPGPFGVGGPASDGDFEVFGDAYTLFTHSDASTGSNTMGVVLDRNDAASTVQLGFEWREAGALKWALRMAPTTEAITLYDTVNAATVFSADFSAASRISFFGVTPQARPAAFTQTYATATRTHAAFTSADLTGITTSTTGTVLAEPSVGYTQAEMQQNFRRIQDQFDLLRADLANLKQLVNSVIDDGQGYGLLS